MTKDEEYARDLEYALRRGRALGIPMPLVEGELAAVRDRMTPVSPREAWTAPLRDIWIEREKGQPENRCTKERLFRECNDIAWKARDTLYKTRAARNQLRLLWRGR